MNLHLWIRVLKITNLRFEKHEFAFLKHGFTPKLVKFQNTNIPNENTNFKTQIWCWQNTNPIFITQIWILCIIKTNLCFETQIKYSRKHKFHFQNTNFILKTQISKVEFEFQLYFLMKSGFVFWKSKSGFQNTDLLLQNTNTCFISKRKFAFSNLCFSSSNLCFQICVFVNLCFQIDENSETQISN